MQNESISKNRRIVGMAILIAAVVALQFAATYIKFGSFSITLALIPIVVGAAMYGKTSGAVLGGAFGVVVLIGCVTGGDIGGNVLWVINPALTAVLCLFKGIAAGFAAGFIYSIVSKKNKYVGVFCAAIVSPVVNTGIFILAMIFLYRDTLFEWAQFFEYSNYLVYAFLGMAGINFLLELLVNIVLSPAVVRVINAVKKTA